MSRLHDPLESIRKHHLLPDEELAKLPPLGGTENEKDAIVQVKWFSPYSGATIFLTEADPETGEFFGWAILLPGCGELGYIYWDAYAPMKVDPVAILLGKRSNVEVPAFERDLYFEPKPLSEAKAEIGEQ